MAIQLQIHQTLGSIGLHVIPANLSIHSQPTDLHISIEPPDLRVERTPGKLDIDQTQAFADAGRIPSLELLQHSGQQAESQLAARLSQRANLTRELNSVANGRQLVADWLMQTAQSSREVVPDLMPRPFSVHIHYTPGRLSLELRNGRVHERVEVHPVHVSATLGAVQVYLERKASVEVSTPPVGELVDAYA